jgi:predicted membrane-bound mannosyltransferase
VAALLALVLALRKDLFRSFLAFWAAAIFFGLSASGEKMPWLEVHIALPLALLAALTVNDAFAAVRARRTTAASPNGTAWRTRPRACGGGSRRSPSPPCSSPWRLPPRWWCPAGAIGRC